MARARVEGWRHDAYLSLLRNGCRAARLLSAGRSRGVPQDCLVDPEEEGGCGKSHPLPRAKQILVIKRHSPQVPARPGLPGGGARRRRRGRPRLPGLRGRAGARRAVVQRRLPGHGVRPESSKIQSVPTLPVQA